MTKCMDCSHVFVKNPKSDTSSGFNPNVDIHKPKPRHFQIYSFIKNYSIQKKTITVAEIGSGYGQLGKILQQDDAIDYIGFEPSPERAEFASSNGVTVINDLSAENSDQYDVVVLDNVLEHVLEPAVLMGVVNRSLKKGGLLL